MLHEVVRVDGRKLSQAWLKTDEFPDCSVDVWMFFIRISFIGKIQDGFWVWKVSDISKLWGWSTTRCLRNVVSFCRLDAAIIISSEPTLEPLRWKKDHAMMDDVICFLCFFNSVGRWQSSKYIPILKYQFLVIIQYMLKIWWELIWFYKKKKHHPATATPSHLTLVPGESKRSTEVRVECRQLVVVPVDSQQRGWRHASEILASMKLSAKTPKQNKEGS